MKILVYGSLRPGCYNFDRFAANYKITDLGEVEVPGFELFSLGPYPGIKEGNGVLTCNILEVSEECHEHIKAMELGANYTEEMVNIEGEELPIYVYQGHVSRDNKVITGDWVEYVSKSRDKNTLYVNKAD